jgi:hypothetical protein
VKEQNLYYFRCLIIILYYFRYLIIKMQDPGPYKKNGSAKLPASEVPVPTLEKFWFRF